MMSTQQLEVYSTLFQQGDEVSFDLAEAGDEGKFKCETDISARLYNPEMKNIKHKYRAYWKWMFKNNWFCSIFGITDIK